MPVSSSFYCVSSKALIELNRSIRSKPDISKRPINGPLEHRFNAAHRASPRALHASPLPEEETGEIVKRKLMLVALPEAFS